MEKPKLKRGFFWCLMAWFNLLFVLSPKMLKLFTGNKSSWFEKNEDDFKVFLLIMTIVMTDNNKHDEVQEMKDYFVTFQDCVSNRDLNFLMKSALDYSKEHFEEAHAYAIDHLKYDNQSKKKDM